MRTPLPARRSQLTRIYDQDLPTLPTHWHTVCDCAPTVAYIRVSKIGKRTTIKSPQIQLDEIVIDARRNKRNIIKIVFDLNVSGASFDRQALNEVIDDVRAGAYKHISVWKWSRWGRNLRGSLEMLALIEDLGAKVDSATEPFDQDSVWGEFGRDQSLVIAAMQGKVIGQTWKSVHNNRLAEKLPHSGRKRFGYDYVNSNGRLKRYELNEAESEILEWAYDVFLAGTGLRKIAETFNARGFRTEFGGLWTYQSVGKMLDTGFAAGFLRMRTEEKKKAMKRKPANKLSSYDRWEVGSQPQIISIETWNLYKAKRLGQSAQPAAAARVTHDLSSLLFCWTCSRRMTTHYAGSRGETGKRQHRWQCTAANSFHPGTSNSIANDDVLPMILDWVSNRARLDWVEGEARRLVNLRGTGGASGIEQLRRELRDESAKAEAMLDLYASGKDSSAAAKSRVLAAVNRAEGRAEELRAQIAALESEPVAAPDFVAMKGLLDHWDSYAPEFRQAALASLIGMVVVSPPPFRRSRVGVATRVRIVPVWEMADWADWLEAARKTRSA